MEAIDHSQLAEDGQSVVIVVVVSAKDVR
jgi:hypothetical protein